MDFPASAATGDVDKVVKLRLAIVRIDVNKGRPAHRRLRRLRTAFAHKRRRVRHAPGREFPRLRRGQDGPELLFRGRFNGHGFALQIFSFGAVLVLRTGHELAEHGHKCGPLFHRAFINSRAHRRAVSC